MNTLEKSVWSNCGINSMQNVSFLAVILVEGAKNLSARLEEGVKWSGYQLVSKVSVGGGRSLGLKKVDLSSRIS